MREGLRPALIILDLMMPVMDGNEFLLEKMKDPRLRGLRTVVVSAGEPHTDSWILASLLKPVSFEKLLQLAAEATYAAE